MLNSDSLHPAGDGCYA